MPDPLVGVKPLERVIQQIYDVGSRPERKRRNAPLRSVLRFLERVTLSEDEDVVFSLTSASRWDDGVSQWGNATWQ